MVMAPEEEQQRIAKEVRAMLASHQQAAAKNRAPLTVGLTYITWREFEDDLQRLQAGRCRSRRAATASGLRFS